MITGDWALSFVVVFWGYVPKNANIAVLFLDDGRPSEPFMNNELSILGLGLSWPDIMYTPSE